MKPSVLNVTKCFMFFIPCIFYICYNKNYQQMRLFVLCLYFLFLVFSLHVSGLHGSIIATSLHRYIALHRFNPLKPELNPICYLLALLAHHFLHVSRMRVKSLTIRLLMSYIYMEHLFLMFLDHTQRRSTVGRTPLDE